MSRILPRQNAHADAGGTSDADQGHPTPFVIEIQHAPWSPIFVKRIEPDGSFITTTCAAEAMTFTQQDSQALAAIAAEVASWTTHPGPVAYVPGGVQ